MGQATSFGAQKMPHNLFLSRDITRSECFLLRSPTTGAILCCILDNAEADTVVIGGAEAGGQRSSTPLARFPNRLGEGAFGGFAFPVPEWGAC